MVNGFGIVNGFGTVGRFSTGGGFGIGGMVITNIVKAVIINANNIWNIPEKYKLIITVI